MKKTILSLSLFAVLPIVLAGIVYAKVERVHSSWMLNAPSAVEFSCVTGTYMHTLDSVTNGGNGNFTGTGYYNPNHSYTWDIDGNIEGNDLTFTLVYTGSNSGYTLNGEGTIDSNGSISGTTDGNCQEFSMPEGSATRFMGNHGQYVRSQEDKQEAAHSRIGMPEQSHGHTHSHD